MRTAEKAPSAANSFSNGEEEINKSAFMDEILDEKTYETRTVEYAR